MGFSKQYETVSEACPSQTSKTELFMEIVWGWNSLTIYPKNSIIDVRLCSEYASDFSCNRNLGWEGTDISNTHEKSTKNQSVTEWYKCFKCGTMDKNVECPCCHAVEAVEYFINYWVWDTVMWMQSLREFKGPATLLNLNTYTNFRTQADLGLPQILRWRSLWH